MNIDIQLQPLWDDFIYKEHQEYALRWMLLREEDVIKGGVLCDEMGLGKTIEMIGLIHQTSLKRNLIVLPLAVLDQWKNTAIKAEINVMIFERISWKLVSPVFIKKPIVYIIGYESLTRRIDLIKHIHFDRLICDEAHRLSNKKSILFQTVHKINATCKWFLTATPIINSRNDILSIFNLLNVSLTHIHISFLMNQYALGRTMDQLRSSMRDAPKIPIIQYHNLDFITEKERDFYIEIQTNVDKRLAYNETGLAAIRLIMLLRQLSIHPQVYIESRKKRYNGALQIEDWVEPSTKFVKIKELLLNESKEKHKWILFCHFHHEMELLNNYLQEISFIRTIEKYSGRLTLEEKNKALSSISKLFQDDDIKTTDVLLIQLKSGGVGLNLQMFDRIIFSGPWWTQASIDQGIGRAVRIGQTSQVIVHHLIIKQEEKLKSSTIYNIDKRMNEKAKQKQMENKSVLSYADSNLKI